MKITEMMDARVDEIKEQIAKSLQDSSTPWSPVLKYLEEKTGVDRLYIFFTSSVLTSLWLAFGFGAELVCNLVGFVYPAYVTFQAIQSENSNDNIKWVTYWIIFALMSMIEVFADLLIKLFPLYWLTKCLFLVWLMICIEFSDTIIIYNSIIKPTFLKFSPNRKTKLTKIEKH